MTAAGNSNPGCSRMRWARNTLTFESTRNHTVSLRKNNRAYGFVLAGLVSWAFSPRTGSVGIHAFECRNKGVDARIKSAQDDLELIAASARPLTLRKISPGQPCAKSRRQSLPTGGSFFYNAPKNATFASHDTGAVMIGLVSTLQPSGEALLLICCRYSSVSFIVQSIIAGHDLTCG
jgi:hypothetical protein